MMSESKLYSIRPLKSSDIMIVVRIMNKIGMDNFRKCMAKENVMKRIADMKADSGLSVRALGMEVAADMMIVLMEHLPDVENDLFRFLASMSGLTVDQVRDLPPAEPINMLADIKDDPSFGDFFTAVSRLLP